MAGGGARREEARWSRAVSDQQRSGLTQRSYCEREGLALSTFSLWRRRLAKSASAVEPARFVELVPTAPALEAGHSAGSAQWDVELDLGDGVTLRIRRRC